MSKIISLSSGARDVHPPPRALYRRTRLEVTVPLLWASWSWKDKSERSRIQDIAEIRQACLVLVLCQLYRLLGRLVASLNDCLRCCSSA